MADENGEKTLPQKFAGVLLDFGGWLSETLGHERALKALVDDLGGNLKSAPRYPEPSVEGLKAYIEAPRPDLEAWIGVVSDVRALIESIRAVAEAIDLGAEATV